MRDEAAAVTAERGVEVEYLVGTMVETPRAALAAGEIAEVAEFFSFGTNDLTQMTFGFSRDDIEGRFMAEYLDRSCCRPTRSRRSTPRGWGSSCGWGSSAAVRRARG
ncbi:MAG: hypothetical protein KatS3mg009_2915 [Acidimicrobiia bacterium]|nr:MAG: hypothetical protein KatS3mg009_2915 [Acidimicrobiia bacterium]